VCVVSSRVSYYDAYTSISDDFSIFKCSKNIIFQHRLSRWKKELLDNAELVFEKKNKKEDSEKKEAELHEQIGRLTVENNWIKKIRSLTVRERVSFLDPSDSTISIRKQVKLLEVSRSSYYYKAVSESDENLLLMKLIDAEYTRHPFYGSRRMVHYRKGQRAFCPLQSTNV